MFGVNIRHRFLVVGCSVTVTRKMLFKEAIAEYLERVSSHKRGYQQERYRTVSMLKHPISELWLHQITSVHIATYRDDRLKMKAKNTDRLLSPNTVRLELALLSDLFSIASIEWGACFDNPVEKVRKPRAPSNRDRRLKPREEAKLLRQASEMKNKEMYSIIVIAIETAMRQGEILGIRWEDINFRLGVVRLHITKNGERRDVPLTMRAKEAFIRLGMKEFGPVFTYKSTGFKSMWKALLNKLGIDDLHFHDLRHEAISRFFELGTMDVVEISTISGHKSLQMLKRYTHLKAHKLVAKLDKNRKRTRKQLLGFSSYPALVSTTDDKSTVIIDFLDFDDLSVRAESADKQTALFQAKDVLLRKIATNIKNNQPLPIPSDIDDLFDSTPTSGQVVLVDPL